jgi:serine/threonine protein kinase
LEDIQSSSFHRYRHLEKIGKGIQKFLSLPLRISGAYGVVYKSLDLTTNKFVAFKKIRLEVEDEGIPSTTLREISYLRMLQFIRHPNIVFLENIIIEGNRLHLIFELVDGEDLNDLFDFLISLLRRSEEGD